MKEIEFNNILENNVTYELAAEVLNSDGVKYAEYGLHNSENDIDAIFYTGYKNTKVFAYIGIPKNASAENPVPAMVLVHGGGGKAKRDWVKKWNEMGYAAISMDLYGNGPEEDKDAAYNTGRKKHPYGGVYPWNFAADFENAGMYQTVVNVVNAHTLLRNFDTVDSSKIGITGISWGGVTTNTVLGIDKRYMFAVPVYGCGYLSQCVTYFGSSFYGADTSDKWDPANFVKNAEIPVMLINGDTDRHFSINSSSLTYDVLKDGYLSIYHELEHSQEAGDSIKQVYNFAKNMFDGVNPYIRIKEAVTENHRLTIKCEVPENNEIKNAVLYYICDETLPADGEICWKAVNDYSADNNVITIDIPNEAVYAYASVIDSNGEIMSTKYMKIE